MLMNGCAGVRGHVTKDMTLNVTVDAIMDMTRMLSERN